MYIRRSDAIKAVENLPNAYNGWSDAYDKACIIQTLEEVSSAKMDGEYIRREDAIKASWKALYDYQDEMETKFRESEDVDFGDWFIHRIFVQGVHGEILNRIVDIPAVEPCNDAVSREWLLTEFVVHAYDIIYDINSHEKGMSLTGIKQVIESAPSVTAETDIDDYMKGYDHGTADTWKIAQTVFQSDVTLREAMDVAKCMKGADE